MFEQFGEFDSCEELNRAAAAQLAEGDTDAIYTIAKENGIDREDAEDYIDGLVPELVTPLMAAYGKLAVEKKELKLEGIMEDWMEYIRIQCRDDGRMAAAVRKKGKSLKGCIAVLLGWSLEHAKPVPEEILKECKISYRVSLGIPGMGQAKKMIREYYMGEGK